ncbi:MAG: DUF2723 domain-containing protein [Endomicrobiales bacterium]|nr:DUF2723 domain-containing protein [Endomicrobiales bacterium]
MKYLNLKSLFYFFIIFGIYLYTLHPTISPYRDSGDLVVASVTLGIAHPTGYPLYVLFGKMFDILIPFGNSAYKINIMSAFFGAGTIYFLTLVFGFIFNQSWILLSSAMLLAFSPAFWRLSQVSEMYSLNAFLASVILFLIAKFYNDTKNNGHKPDFAVLLLVAFLCGFSTGNHQTIIFIFPGILWFLLSCKDFRLNHYFWSFIFFVLGFSVYLILPLRVLSEPVSSWGDLKTINGLLRVITRADYGGMRLHPEQSKFHWTLGLIFQHLLVYAKSLLQQFALPGLLAGLWGIYVTRKNRFFQFLLIALLVSGPGFVILSNLPVQEETTLPILEPHFVLPNLIFVLFISAALFSIFFYKLGRIAILLLVMFSFVRHLPFCSYRAHYFAYDYGRNLMATLQKGSLIFNPDDPTTFITTYLQQVQGKRPDLRLIAYFRTKWGYELIKKRYPDLLPKREILSGQELERIILDYNRGKYSIYAELPGKFPQGYFSYPYGLMYKLSESTENNPSNLPFNLYVFRNLRLDQSKNDFFTNKIMSYYASAHNNIGLAYSNKNMLTQARQEYYKALSIDNNLIPTLNNLGTLEYSLANYKESEEWFKRVLELHPDSDTALFNLGLAYKIQGKLTLAEEHFKEAWQKGYNFDAGNELGLLYLNTGKPELAEKFFKEIIKRNPKYIFAYYNLGLALKTLDKHEEANKYLEYYMKNINDEKEKKEVENIIKKL